MKTFTDQLHVWESTISRMMHEYLRFKSYVTKGQQLISNSNRNNSMFRSKLSLKKVTYFEESIIIYFLSKRKIILFNIKKLTEEISSNCVSASLKSSQVHAVLDIRGGRDQWRLGHASALFSAWVNAAACRDTRFRCQALDRGSSSREAVHVLAWLWSFPHSRRVWGMSGQIF